MATSIIQIDSTTIPHPTSFDVQRFKLTKAGRVASGLMVQDFIAKKRKFLFSYDYIDSADHKALIDILFSDDIYYTLTYTEDGVEYDVTVYVGQIDQGVHLNDGGATIWKNFKFNLIEQ